jgi:hypothetical protein
MDLKEQLESNGFKLEIEDNGIFQQYVKIVGEEQVKHLVFAITPIQEVFVWIPENHNAEDDDPLQDGVKIILDVDSVEKAILVTECIAGLDFDF